MDEELLRFFNKINFTDYDESLFAGVKIDKVVVVSKTSSFKVYLKLPDLISFSCLFKLDLASKNGLSGKSLKIEYSYDNITNENKKNFFLEILEKLKKEKPSLSSLEEKNVIFNEDDIVIEASSKFEQELFISFFLLLFLL